MSPSRRDRGAPSPRRRRRHARTVAAVRVLLAATALGVGIAACQGGLGPEEPSATIGASPEGAPSEGAPSEGAPSEGAPSEPEEAAPALPELPSLHPEVDQLPAATVTITPAAPSVTEVDVAVRVAATPETRRRGLMEVPDLPDDVGMLFLFDAPRTGGFWMWNTLVPLDIGFIAADGTMHEILAMDPCEATDPSDCPSYAPERSYVAALEVRQGWFEANAITPGASVTWPARVGTEPSQ